MEIGTSNDNKGGFKKKNRFRQEAGDVIFRILPPFGRLAQRGVWSKFHAVHFGYKTTEGKHRPFESPLEKKGKVVLVEDAALNRINTLKEQLEKAMAENNAPLVAKLRTLVGLKGVYNMDSNHHMNVIDLQGNIGEFGIRYKAKLLLDAEIEKLKAKGCDPRSVDDGRFFVFHRTGQGPETSFKVSIYTEEVDVPGYGKMERPVVHKLTPEIIARLGSEAWDLENEIATKLTADEVREIVEQSDLLTGKSPACNKYFDSRWKANSEKVTVEPVDPNEPEEQRESVMPVSKVVEPIKTEIVTVVPVAAKTVTAVVSNDKVAMPEATAATSPVDDLSNEEFFRQIGV